MLNVGDKVMIISDNDNYVEYVGKELEIVEASYSIEDHQGYDESMEGMGLYDLVDEDGEDVPFSLYEYELCVV